MNTNRSTRKRSRTKACTGRNDSFVPPIDEALLDSSLKESSQMENVLRRCRVLHMAEKSPSAPISTKDECYNPMPMCKTQETSSHKAA
ncbi:hypothetical protein scyTo_0003975 [Scyliorhinus torazame]|uniref:Uncharacterized protein n=1 Tax=Scyliorhinus torazame TaxID=75743 RepID=A0A401NID7_SCYTO|nr:hypothetical protein [Scyliorhinus torazame]